MTHRPSVTAAAAGFAVVLLAFLLTASSVKAAGRVYWGNFGGNSISFANLDGSGGGSLAGVVPNGPEGVAIDAAAGRIYWVDYKSGAIGFASLEGGSPAQLLLTAGAVLSSPGGMAIDPKGGRAYWTDSGNGGVAFANLNGSGGGAFNTGGATASADTRGVVVDPAGGRVYWANFEGSKISFANLDGSGGGGDVNTNGASVDGPEGVAIDRVGGRIYWANQTSNKISFANLDGSGGGELVTTGATVKSPTGIAVDHAAGRVYWANDATGISFASLDGSGGADLNMTGAAVNGARYPVLLEPPAGAGAPRITYAGGKLSCSEGRWAPDLVESFLYRAPQTVSFAWERGKRPAGSERVVLASQAGNYRCEAVARNQAGSTAQPSETFAYFKLGKPRFDRGSGTASLPVAVPVAGTLALSGKDIVKGKGGGKAGAIVRRVGKAGSVKLLVKVGGQTAKKLARTGRATVRITISFRPKSGTSANQTKQLRLRKTTRL